MTHNSHQIGSYASFNESKRIIPEFVRYTEISYNKMQKGWISVVDPREHVDMVEWCNQNLNSSCWSAEVCVIMLEKEEDVSWFMMRWS